MQDSNNHSQESPAVVTKETKKKRKKSKHKNLNDDLKNSSITNRKLLATDRSQTSNNKRTKNSKSSFDKSIGGARVLQKET